MYEEEIEILEIPLDKVNNDNIKENVCYSIYKEKNSENTITSIWGENKLILSPNNLKFSIDEIIPFKYHRGILNLEYETKFYITEINKYFEKDEDISIETSCNEEDNHITYQIHITSKSRDVDYFIGKMLGFEFEFNNKLTKVENKIKKLIG